VPTLSCLESWIASPAIPPFRHIPTPDVTQCDLPAEFFDKLAISALGIDRRLDVRETVRRESIKVGLIGAFNCRTSWRMMALALPLARSEFQSVSTSKNGKHRAPGNSHPQTPTANPL